MARDEYGYDPDESYTAEDNPFYDATDGAHPAWWRGSDYSIDRVVETLHNLLDGKQGPFTTPCAELNRLSERILKLMEKKQ